MQIAWVAGLAICCLMTLGLGLVCLETRPSKMGDHDGVQFAVAFIAICIGVVALATIVFLEHGR